MSMYLADFSPVEYGVSSDELFGDTGMGAGDGTDFGPGAGDTMYTDQSTVFAVQLALQRRGFNPGVVDGKWGPNTEMALAAFNAQRGVIRRGPPDLDTLHALGLSPGGFAYSGAGVAPGSVVLTGGGSLPATPLPSPTPHMPGTVTVPVPPGTIARGGTQINSAGGTIGVTPQGGGGGKGGGMLGFLKGNGTLLAVGVAAAFVGTQLLGRGRPAPRRRRRR